MANPSQAYMTVPEKIELANTGPTGYLMTEQSSDHRYKPMKIPDTITFESGNPDVTGREASGGGERDYFREVKQAEGVGQLQPKVEDASRESLVSKKPPSTSFNPPSSDHEQRIRTLEGKVQRLTDSVLSYEQSPPTGRAKEGNGFWYVLTFAGWMMVPLIAVFMYQYKKIL